MIPRLIRPAAVVLLVVLIVSAIPAAAGAQEVAGDTAGDASEVEVRIVARRLDDGRVEFGLQQRGDGSWGGRLLPSRRFFPPDATVGRWLSSSRLVLSVDATAFEDPSAEVDVRIVARRLASGRVEFGLQQRGGDGSWGERLLPSRRFFPPDATVGRWLSSSPLSVSAVPPESGSVETPQEPAPEPGAPVVAASGYHTCAINAGGGVDCWGDNSARYRIGDVSIHQARSPAPVGGLGDAVAISIGGSPSGSADGPTCVLHADRSVSCWGWDTHGVLGQGTPGAPPTPQDGSAGGDSTVPRVIYAGGRGEPTRVPGITDAVAVAAGSRHVCVLHADGGVSCWGSNSSGQLGDGTLQSRNWPYRIPGLSGVVAIGAGGWHSCAVHADGTISCWGSNSSRQLGDGTTSYRLSPVKVSRIDDAVLVSPSDDFTCAVRGSGGISCWGQNAGGVSPVPVRGISDAVAVDTGHWSSCALHRDGAVSCWGANAAGELGIGTKERRSRPEKLREISDAVAITVSSRNSWGGSHACAVTADRRVLCWGANRYGQLGVGDTEPRLVPTEVAAVGARGPDGRPTVIPRLAVPDWSDEEWRIDAGPFRAAMDDVVREKEGRFPWLRIAWDHVRDEVRLFDAASGGSTTIGCGFSASGTYECSTSMVAIGTDLNERTMQELLHIGVHELAHVYDGATALTPNRAWGAVQLYFAVTYPDCQNGGEETIADTMLHLVFPEAPLSYYGRGSSCPTTPATPTEEAEAILLTGLSGEVPRWYTENVTDGAALWWMVSVWRSADLLSNLMGEFGGLCLADFLMNWRIAPSRDSNPFADGGC